MSHAIGIILKVSGIIHIGFFPVIVETGMIKKFCPKVTLTGGNGTIQHGANGRCNFTVEVIN